MYHKIPDQEKNPGNYILKNVDPTLTEDECFDLLSKPRQTQKTIGLYLKKVDDLGENEEAEEKVEVKGEKKRFSLTARSHDLDRELNLNKGFWVDKPQESAHLTYKLRDRYQVDVPKKTQKSHGVFYRPECLELDYVRKLAKAGKLYSDEDISDSEEEEEEVKPDTTECVPLRQTRYKICDPCKEKPKKKQRRGKDLNGEDFLLGGRAPPFKKIPTGCQCNSYGRHFEQITTWDNPFEDEIDMLRKHEMNKVMKPFKASLLKENYEKQPPVKFMAHEFGKKKTFPVYLITNL